MTYLLIALIGSTLVGIVTLLLTVWVLQRRLSSWTGWFQSVITPPDSQTPSEAQKFVQSVVTSTVASINGREMASASAESRQARAAESEILEKVISSQFPEAAAGLKILFGDSWARVVVKNRYLVPLVEKYAPMIAAGGKPNRHGVAPISNGGSS